MNILFIRKLIANPVILAGFLFALVMGYQFLLNQQLEKQIDNLRNDLIESEAMNLSLLATVKRNNAQLLKQFNRFEAAKIASQKLTVELEDTREAHAAKISELLTTKTPKNCEDSMKFLRDALSCEF